MNIKALGAIQERKGSRTMNGSSDFCKVTLHGDFYLEGGVRTSSQMPAPHFHDMYEIYYLISGERNYSIGNRSYNVSPGDLLFIPSCEIHRATNTSAPFHERIVIHFNKSFLGEDAVWLDDERCPFVTGTHLITLPVRVRKRVEELLSLMVIEYYTKDQGFETTLKAALLELLVLSVRRNKGAMGRKIEQAQIEYAMRSCQKISEIISYMNDNYEKPLTLESLARQCYISPCYLSRLFKRTTGCSFIKYLTEIRIKTAQRLLRETEWKVGVIAEKTGFGDLAHFGKMFKKITRCTPLQYRNLSRHSSHCYAGFDFAGKAAAERAFAGMRQEESR